MKYPALILSAALSLALIFAAIPAHAGSYGSAAAAAFAPNYNAVLAAPVGSCGVAQANVTTYAPPVASAPVVATPQADVSVAAPAYAPPVVAAVPQLRIIQRVVTPVYVQPQAAIVNSYAAPANVIVQNQVASPYVASANAFANVGAYGTANALAAPVVGHSRAFALGRNRAFVGAGVVPSRTVTKSRAVTKTGRPGLLNRIFGR